MICAKTDEPIISRFENADLCGPKHPLLDMTLMIPCVRSILGKRVPDHFNVPPNECLVLYLSAQRPKVFVAARGTERCDVDFHRITLDNCLVQRQERANNGKQNKT